MKKLFYLMIAVLSVSLISCEDKKPENPVIEENNQDSVFVKNNGIDVGVPTPSEMFESYTGISKNKVTSFNDVSNVEKYLTKDIQSLNLGVFISDYAFNSKVNGNKNNEQYLQAILELFKSLGAEDAVDMDVFMELADAMDSGEDSIVSQMDEQVTEIFNTLEEKGFGNELSLIMIGGWIEGVFLASELEPYSDGGAIVSGISDQKFALEQIISFSENFASDENVNKWRNEAIKIHDFYDVEQIEGTETETKETEDGKFVFSGGDVETVLNETQYSELLSIVSELRSQIITQ
jgi:hypothetical protein